MLTIGPADMLATGRGGGYYSLTDACKEPYEKVRGTVVHGFVGGFCLGTKRDNRPERNGRGLHHSSAQVPDSVAGSGRVSGPAIPAQPGGRTAASSFHSTGMDCRSGAAPASPGR